MSLTYTNIVTLATNPVCTLKDYMAYFQKTKNAAHRMLTRDKELREKRVFTYLDFYHEYEAFPDANFQPQWITVKVPKLPKISV